MTSTQIVPDPKWIKHYLKEAADTLHRLPRAYAKARLTGWPDVAQNSLLCANSACNGDIQTAGVSSVLAPRASPSPSPHRAQLSLCPQHCHYLLFGDRFVRKGVVVNGCN